MANFIHSRSKPDGDFMPTKSTLCYKCMDHGEYFVFIRGQRKYACLEHFRLWQRTADQMGDRLLSSQWE